MSVAIVPRPESLVALPKEFALDSDVRISASAECERMAEQLARRLRDSTGHRVPVVIGASDAGTISVSISTDLAPSSCAVEVDDSGVRLVGGDAAGAFYANALGVDGFEPRPTRNDS
jgi:hexosaminidase